MTPALPAPRAPAAPLALPAPRYVAHAMKLCHKCGRVLPETRFRRITDRKGRRYWSSPCNDCRAFTVENYYRTYKLQHRVSARISARRVRSTAR